MRLHQLKPAPGSRTPKRIVGRGEGSTLGQTCGKGMKGQTCRSGDTIMNGFEGGQMPLYRRLPKRGFNHPSKIKFQPINVEILDIKFEKGETVDGSSLFKKGLLDDPETPYKILGVGKLSKALTVVADKASSAAASAVKKAGGTLKTGKTAH